MSAEALTAVWEHATGTPGQRNVLLALANRADEHGICWPGITELMTKTRMSRRGVQGALRSLEKSGQLVPVDGERGGRGITVLRWIKLPGLDGELEGANRRRRKGADGRVKGADRRTERAQSGDVKGAPIAPEPIREPVEASDEASTSPNPTTSQVLLVLEDVATAKQTTRPTATAVQHAIDAFPDRDHLEVAGELEFWAIHGNGRRRAIKAIAQTYRNFLRKADPAAAGGAAQRSVTERRHQALRTLVGREAA